MHTEPDGLFELPANTPAATAAAAPAEARPAGGYVPTNDMDLITEVLRRATEPGYVLLTVTNAASSAASSAFSSACEQVWRGRIRRGTDIDPVPVGEADAVRQLLDQRFLIRGGHSEVRYRHPGQPRGRHREGHAISVLMTSAARTRLTRWRAYTRPACWGQPRAVA